MRTAIILILISTPTVTGAEPAPAGRGTAPVDDAVVRRLIDSLNDPDLDVRQNLAIALARIGPASVEPLIEALRDKNSDRRAGAAHALGLIGVGARTALPGLLDLLKDDDVGVRRQASYAIGRIVPPGRSTASVAVTPPAGGRGK